jgi:hypothetical protein
MMGEAIVLVVPPSEGLAENFMVAALRRHGFGVEVVTTPESAGFRLGWGMANLALCFREVRSGVTWAERTYQALGSRVALLLRSGERTSSGVPVVTFDLPHWETSGEEKFLAGVKALLS